ncbi:MAG: hypothetical protein EOP85_00470 [Verrucomicrobiaceae bacterium]|nr:MAG: hypothetical protein EOP85_00470 [Verrucomicrobiaceae bacterium]
MFEKLEILRPDLKPMFGKLRKVEPEIVVEMRKRHPECPDPYWAFLLERGAGAMEQDGEPFFFEDRLLNADSELYCDRQIYQNGAKGDVMVFGHESMGTAYGFDTGDGWKLVEVDEFRAVTPLELTFEEFVVGLVLCYPQIAMRNENGEWVDGVGARYRPNG